MSEQGTPETSQGTTQKLDPAQLRYALDQLRAEQNLVPAAAAGAVAAVVGAALWALVTVTTGLRIGWMAVGVGFLVGYSIRTVGKGIDWSFGIVGAVLALFGCALGNLLAVCGMIAVEQDAGFFDVLSSLDLAVIQELMVATFTPMDLLFYGIAVYEGYKLSFRQLTEQELTARITGQGFQPK